MKPKGYGFVKMKTMEAQNKVLGQNELFIDGRVVQVNNLSNSTNIIFFFLKPEHVNIFLALSPPSAGLSYSPANHDHTDAEKAEGCRGTSRISFSL